MTDSGIHSRDTMTSADGDGAVKPVNTPRPHALAPPRRRDTVAVLLFSHGPIFESAMPISVFGVDRRDAGIPHYRILVCGGEPGQLVSTAGVRVSAPYGLDAIDQAGTVIVPTWRSPGARPPEPALAALRRAHREGARIVGLCAGAFVLAAAGLLEGRPATTHWMYAPALAKHYPRVRVDPRVLYVDDGDLMTSAGAVAGLDLCLHLVRNDHGSKVANALARRLVVPAHRPGGQAQYIDHSLPDEVLGDPLAGVLSWALEHLDEPLDVETLAERASMSRRTFDRRFRTLTGSAPFQWLLTQRVLHAQRLLESTALTIGEIAECSGFHSSVALRGHFHQLLGISPGTYRVGFNSGELRTTRVPGDPRRTTRALVGKAAAENTLARAGVRGPREQRDGHRKRRRTCLTAQAPRARCDVEAALAVG